MALVKPQVAKKEETLAAEAVAQTAEQVVEQEVVVEQAPVETGVV